MRRTALSLGSRPSGRRRGAAAVALSVLVACGGARPSPTSPTTRPRALPTLAGDCAADGWCFENPRPRSVADVVLWGTARDDVWAVGVAGMILHFDGATWTRVRGTAKDNLYAITGTSRADVWAVGDVGTALHWDGARWTSHRIDTPALLNAAGVDEHGRVWASSDAGGVWTWDGRGWKVAVDATCPDPVCGAPRIASASGGRLRMLPDDRVWDGARLDRDRPPPTRRFGGTRASTVWQFGTQVERWDGVAWRTIALPDDFTLRALYGATDEDVWLVGKAGKILRWDGARLIAVDSHTRGDLTSAWGSADDDVWLAGVGGLLHWDGKAINPATRSISDADLADVWGVTDCDVWAVGDAGSVLHRGCDVWAAVASGVTTRLHGVGGSGSSDVWIVGDHGTILRWDGHAIAPVASPTTVALFAVWAAGPRDAWAVGDAGTIVHWDGTGWRTVGSPVPRALRRLAGADPRHVIAVGDRGVIVAWDGARWTELGTPPYCQAFDGGRDDLTGVALIAGDPIITCRGAGVMRRTGGGWSEPRDAIGQATAYHDVAVRGTTVAIVGWYGTVVRGELAGWTKSATPTAEPLRAVWISPSGATWVVGARGTILSQHPNPHRASPASE